MSAHFPPYLSIMRLSRGEGLVELSGSWAYGRRNTHTGAICRTKSLVISEFLSEPLKILFDFYCRTDGVSCFLTTFAFRHHKAVVAGHIFPRWGAHNEKEQR